MNHWGEQTGPNTQEFCVFAGELPGWPSALKDALSDRARIGCYRLHSCWKFRSWPTNGKCEFPFFLHFESMLRHIIGILTFASLQTVDLSGKTSQRDFNGTWRLLPHPASEEQGLGETRPLKPPLSMTGPCYLELIKASKLPMCQAHSSNE